MKTRFPTTPFGKITRRFAQIAIALFLGVWLLYLCGARINRTHSLPVGLYWQVNRHPKNGDIVSFWPDDSTPFRMARERGYLIAGPYNHDGRGGYGALLKTIAALAGDVVSITGDGVIVNGRLLANSKPLPCDNTGAPLPQIRLVDYRLGEHDVLFISEHLPRSFDARYFGIQHTRQIIDVLVPVIVW